MAERALVKDDIDAGAELIRLLDGEGFEVRAAAWLHAEDDDWHLLIGSKRAASNLTDAYVALSRVLSTRPDLYASIDTARVRIVPPDNSFLALLGRVVSPINSMPKRIRNSAFEGVYIDDALVYRAAA